MLFGATSWAPRVTAKFRSPRTGIGSCRRRCLGAVTTRAVGHGPTSSTFVISGIRPSIFWETHIMSMFNNLNKPKRIQTFVKTSWPNPASIFTSQAPSGLQTTPRSMEDPKANFRIGESRRANLGQQEGPSRPGPSGSSGQLHPQEI